MDLTIMTTLQKGGLHKAYKAKDYRQRLKALPFTSFKAYRP